MSAHHSRVSSRSAASAGSYRSLRSESKRSRARRSSPRPPPAPACPPPCRRRSRGWHRRRARIRLRHGDGRAPLSLSCDRRRRCPRARAGGRRLRPGAAGARGAVHQRASFPQVSSSVCAIPKRHASATPHGNMPSPRTRSRNRASCSTTSTCAPFRARVMTRLDPASPPPMIATSKSMAFFPPELRSFNEARARAQLYRRARSTPSMGRDYHPPQGRQRLRTSR